jgi:hypothetical protein
VSSSPADHDNQGPRSFMEGFKEGYEEEDKKAREDKGPLHEKILHGAVGGVAETTAHPFRWLRKLLG